jgi:catechol 2,3-dioxygenase-like lactoylglutathione lyase family enzyme
MSVSNLRFDQFFQTAYVTRDMDVALRVFADQFGVHRFQRTDSLVVDLDNGASAQFHLALAYVGSLQLEVIQPLARDVGIFEQGLPAQGNVMAMHHICYDIDSEQELDSLLEQHRSGGREIMFEGRRAGRSRFAFVDTRAQLGYLVEYVCATPEGKKAREAIPRN